MVKRVIIIGAGEAGRMVVREILANPDAGYQVVGYLDDDTALHGQTLETRPVLGACDRLIDLVPEKDVKEAIIAVPTGSREFVRRVITLCRDAGISFKIVPGMIEIIEGPVRLEQIRDVRPEDLLGRETVEFDEEDLRRGLGGRRIMVTGAGGSIGGELCRQIGRFGLEELQLLGRGENQIFDIEHQLRLANPELNVRAVIADIREGKALTRMLGELRPHYVYHTAAHKHVHYMEAYPEEAIKNNVFGTVNLIRAAVETGVERVVMISTDKAVNPRGVMGASKRIAEFLMTDWSRELDRPRLLTVRFGNVLGSRGSVVPLFINQIRAGGPVTVSDPRATRFFMSLKEACLLVVQASMMGDGGEIFVLRMGTPLKIIEVAKDLIALHGLRPELDLKIKIVGLRPGEKLHEALTVDGEVVTDSVHDYILAAHPQLPEGWHRERVLGRLEELTRDGDGQGIRDYLSELIPDARLGDG
ncbi:MAG: polysaccharide biosynthesis protein [Candidatus Latescibacterota bacterium]|nr:MAG: polysaccharide biosynthesis protein [Candidatus Latescibacterota bacterium]